MSQASKLNSLQHMSELLDVTNSKTQFFARLLALPIGRPRFRLRGIGLIVSLAIGGAESMGGKVAFNFLECSL